MNEVLTQANQITETGLSYIQTTVVLIVTIGLGLLVGLLGLKLVRVWAALAGLLLGAAIGGVVVYFAGLTGWAAAGAVLGCGVVLAILGAVLRKPGIFVYILVSVAGGCISLIGITSIPVIAISLALGLVLAIATMKLFDPLVIIITSINGGVTAGTALTELIGMQDNMAVTILVPLVLSAVCVCVQFILRSRQVGRKQVRKAIELRKQESRENEVEEARKLLDGELEDIDSADEDYDGDDYDEFADDDDESADDEAAADAAAEDAAPQEEKPETAKAAAGDPSAAEEPLDDDEGFLDDFDDLDFDDDFKIIQ